MEVNRVRIGTLTLEPLICHLSLLAIGFLSCTMIVNFTCATDETVELAACDYRPKGENFTLVVRFCPNLNYTIVLECSVTNTYSLKWILNDSKTDFYPEDSCEQGPKMNQGFNFSLIEKVIDNDTNETDNNSYISQLRVSTSHLKIVVNNSNEFSVTCQSSNNTKRMSFIKISEGINPQIVSAEFGESDEIIVTWISANNDLTRTEIVAEYENGTKMSVFTEWYKREGQINVTESSATYNVTVIEYTMCNQSFSSNTTRVSPSSAIGK
ncbi:hypothetical protein GBAR_LOCUS27475 [Geodia barretti]|uniref:Uncharacterized protein n=1 Tax=Geodia barretti TaxID=519541 RepID=A0AA35XEY8_GEOBA|nr:hypothetical protein GBAR_LOCUS27475 [Geodia barretti]